MTDGNKEQPASDQFPVNLAEGLGVTPLTYLVPTQDLAPLLAPNDFHVVSQELQIDEADRNAYENQVKPLLKGESQQIDKADRNSIEHLDLRKELQDSTLIFRGASSSLMDDSTSESKSLFDGIDGIAKDILSTVQLVQSERIVDPETISKRKNLSKKSASIAVSQAIPPRIPIKRSLSKVELTTNPVDLKQRKSEIGVQHLQLESISNQKLLTLVVEKIGLSDEHITQRMADIWMDIPNRGPVLSDNVLIEIEQYLTKVVGTKLVDEIPLEVLERIKKLSVQCINSIDNIEWSELDLDADFWPLKYALNSLKAVSLILIIFNTKREEKKLYLDEDLMVALNFIYRLIEDLILRITIEGKSYTPETSKMFVGLIHLLQKNFDLLSAYISENQGNDNIITKLEYLSIMTFFHVCEKGQFSSHYPMLKMASMKLLIKIFGSKRDQRKFLLNEILSNFDRLPVNKTQARQLKLARGFSIQPFTALLLNILGTLNVKNIELRATFREGDITESNLIALQEVLKEWDQERDLMLSIISSMLINKLITNLNANFKQSFEMFITDLLNVVALPEWPTAEPLLSSITNTLISNSENQSSIVETYILEIIGLIGSTMLELKGTSDLPDIDVTQVEFDFSTTFSYLYTLRDVTPFEYSSDAIVFEWLVRINNTYLSEDSPEKFRKKIQDTYNGVLSGYYKDQSNDFIRKTNGSASEETATLSYKRIILCGSFMQLYQNFLNHLLKAIDHPKIKSRTRAMKNLAQLIDKDSRLLNIPLVKSSLSNRIGDPSPLVRLAVLEIFDQYILKKPELIGEFYQTLILTNDKSVSVRTRSLKIAKRIFLETTSDDIKVFALEKVLRRLEDDEENVLELAKSILMESVFSDLGKVLEESMNDRTKQREYIGTLIRTLVKLIDSTEKNWQLFEQYLNTDIIRKTDENKKIHANLMKIVGDIVEELLTFVIEFMDTEKQVEVEGSLGLLSIFAKCDYDLINQEQLMSLQPYLTSETTTSNAISYYTLVVFRYSINKSSTYRDQFLTDSQTSLLRRLTKFTTRELEEAMPLVWSLSVAKKDTAKIANAAASCLSLIRPLVDQAFKDKLVNSDPKVLRLIYLIGSFGKYCELESNKQVFVNSKKIGLKEKESVLSLITKFLLIFTRKKVNRQVRRAAVRNIIGVSSTHPKLFMSEPILKVMDQEFSGSSIDFKEVMIQGILDFLEREEKRSLKRSGHDGKVASKLGIDVDVFHGNSKMFENDGICASLVQRYMQPILDMCIYDDGEHSFLAVKYLRFIVKLGFANPRICIPTVVALEASKVSYIRSIALEIHRDLHSKHESLIDSSYTHGLKLAVKYRTNLSSSMLNENPLFFEKFYKVIEESKTSKKKLFSQLIKSFNFDISNIKEKDSSFLKDYVLFLAHTIPHAELATLEEVFSLVDGIDEVIANSGINLINTINKNMEENYEGENWKVFGNLSLTVLALLELKNCLIQSYKIPEVGQRSELKSHKAKHTEVQVKLFDIDPEAGSYMDICKQLLEVTL